MLVEIPDNLLIDIPFNIWLDVLNEAQGIKSHGALFLEMHFRDKHVQFYKTNLEKSNSVTKTEGSPDVIRKKHYNLKKGIKE